MTWRQYLFSFDGRINRARFWLFYVVVWGMEFAIFFGILLTYALLSAAGIASNDPFSNPSSIYPGVAFAVVFCTFVLAVNYMYLAVMSKRLHDRNRSARWIVIYFLVPVPLLFMPELLFATKLIPRDDQVAQIATVGAGLVGMALYLWGFVELHCLRGTVGDNTYGPDPLAGQV